MNSQELRALQEAYSQVYELDESFADRIDKQVKTNKEYAKKRKPVNASSFADRIDKQVEQRKNEKDRLKEQVDLYDIILSHLLDEGYAETQEQAEVIMVNMSEDWRESIVEAMKPLPQEKMKRKIEDIKSSMKSTIEKSANEVGMNPKRVRFPFSPDDREKYSKDEKRVTNISKSLNKHE